MIEMNHPTLSIRRQCQLIGLNRASYYYIPASESPLNLRLMRLIDEEYTDSPFYGYRKITNLLQRRGYEVNHKRVARLMRLMGLRAVYPGPRTSVPAQAHKIYPYLLRGVQIVHPNQVWSADITYIRLTGGFMYLVAIIDWYSRFVLAWRLSNTLDGAFCLEALDEALHLYGRPGIFNTDQGSQFTAHDFTGRLETAHVRVSMDGRGRAFDNIFIERLWRTVKYEDIYLKEYDTVPMLETGLTNYFHKYDYLRPHQNLNYLTPAEVYFSC
jgi:putative transposase